LGKRSRKRPAPDRPPTTRAERDARRRTATPTVVRRGTREKPPAPWGPFPLTEILVLLALVLGILGFVNVAHQRGKVMIVAAMVLGSLGGLEISIREHFAGFKSHTTLLAGGTAVMAMMLIYALGGQTLAGLVVAVATGTLIFVLGFWRLREAFRRRSGGASFR